MTSGVLWREFMKLLLCFLFAALTAISAEAQTQPTPAADAGTQTVETIVCVRHGEKPKGGLGQLNCKGLNRALALPKVLIGKLRKTQFCLRPQSHAKIRRRAILLCASARDY